MNQLGKWDFQYGDKSRILTEPEDGKTTVQGDSQVLIARWVTKV